MKKYLRINRILMLLGLLLLILWIVLSRPFVLSYNCCKVEISAQPETLKRHTRIISTDFSPRNWKNTANLNKIADYVSDEFKKTSAKVYFQDFETIGSVYRNVVAEYGTADAKETIVVGAHYDAYDEYAAADDNASAVAGLLELGRLLSLLKPTVKIVLVAYSLEEPPFFRTDKMGSAVHAASLAGQNVTLMISLEMIGYFSDEKGSQNYPSPLLHLFYPSKGNFIALVGPLSFSDSTRRIKKAFLNSVALPVVSINAPAFVPGIDFSDHLNYWQQGIDAVMITDTAFLRNLAYHKPNDTFERLNYSKMAQVVTGVAAFLDSEGK